MHKKANYTLVLANIQDFDVTYIEKQNIMRISIVDLGEKLRQRRELLGLLQSQLSVLSGVSTRTIQLVEQGKGNPSLDTLFHCCLSHPRLR